MRTFLILLVFLAGLFPSVGVEAQQLTVDRATVAKELKDRHGEVPVAMGIAENGGVLELFASEDGATWTLILTMPDRRVFTVGAGRDWSNIRHLKKGTAL